MNVKPEKVKGFRFAETPLGARDRCEAAKLDQPGLVRVQRQQKQPRAARAHAFPVLRPARAVLARLPLGPGPSLHQLRCGSLRFVRRLHRYYGRVLTSHARSSAATAPRLPAAGYDGFPSPAKHETSRFPSKERLHMPDPMGRWIATGAPAE